MNMKMLTTVRMTMTMTMAMAVRMEDDEDDDDDDHGEDGDDNDDGDHDKSEEVMTLKKTMATANHPAATSNNTAMLTYRLMTQVVVWKRLSLWPPDVKGHQHSQVVRKVAVQLRQQRKLVTV